MTLLEIYDISAVFLLYYHTTVAALELSLLLSKELLLYLCSATALPGEITLNGTRKECYVCDMLIMPGMSSILADACTYKVTILKTNHKAILKLTKSRQYF